MEFPSPQFLKHLIFFPGLPGQVFRVPAIPKHQGTGARVQLSDLGVEEKLVEAVAAFRGMRFPMVGMYSANGLRDGT